METIHELPIPDDQELMRLADDGCPHFSADEQRGHAAGMATFGNNPAEPERTLGEARLPRTRDVHLLP